MSVNKHNAEGYRDPTTYEALTNIEQKEKAARREAEHRKYMPKVYIISPFAGDVENNIIKARRYCLFAVKQGCIPYASHLFFPQFLHDNVPAERELGLFMGLVYLAGCREAWVFGDYVSSGMKAEIDHAVKRGITIRYFNENCEEV